MLSQGDVIRIPDNPRDPQDKHCHVIISYPDKDPDNVVLVPIDTYDDDRQDDTCILEPHDSPGRAYVQHRSYIEYRKGSVTAVAVLEAKIKNKAFSKKTPIGAVALEKILAGAKDAAESSLPNKCSVILLKQSLI